MRPDDEVRWTRLRDVLQRVVKPARWPQTMPVTITARHLHGEPVPFAQAVAGTFEPFAEGGRWGPDWDTTWFHIEGAVPQEWAGNDVALVVHLGYDGGTGFGAEGLVWVDGEPLQGISPHHREVPVAGPAEGGEHVDLYIEAAANPPAPALDPGPMLLADPGGEPQLELRCCHLTVVDREVEALVRDWLLVDELAEASGDAEQVDRLLEALERAAHAVDPGDVAATAHRARAELADVIGAAGSQPRHTLLAVGNSHLDTAWLWPLRETRRKAARTFSNAAALLDDHPDYTFAASQAQQFAWIKEDYPALWERVQAAAAEGRFDLVGSMWVEADCNLPSGESLVRQIVHGKRFFREELGIDTPGLWLPDVFGYPASLPQILAEADIDWFLTQKMSWNDTNRFPHHTFWWEGIDGTRVFTHFPPADTYCGELSVAELLHAEHNFSQADVRRQAIYLYGHGDGGGGPTLDMIERARRVADIDGLPCVELVTASEASERLMDEGDPAELPVWVGELYLELHRGTYTTQGAVKKANRRLELALRDAELWALEARRLAGRTVPAAELDQAWKTLLLHQFHDVIPGTSIHWVYEDSAADHQKVADATDRIIDESFGTIAATIDMAHMARPVLVANSLPFERREVVEIDGELRLVTAPPVGWSLVDLGQPDVADAPPVRAGDGFMDNGIVRVEWDEQGLLSAVRHLASGRDALPAGARANVLQLLDDHPQHWDAWDIDADAFERAVDLTVLERLELVEDDEQRATLRICRSFGSSHIEQLVQLSRGSGRVEIHCAVEWHETHKLLKVAFPVDVRSAAARHEIQFGHVERPTHTNTSWDAARFETCAHTWVDLSEHGFGVALLNDSKYGHDVSGNVIRLSLLRAPTWPDPVADRGHHTFAYALYPHAGSFAEGGVIEQAHGFNTPLRVQPITDGGGSERMRCHSIVAVDDPGVVLSAVKAADDGDGMIIRLYEAFGGRRRVRLGVPGAVTAQRVDLLEEPRAGRDLLVTDHTVELDLNAFELVTLRIVADWLEPGGAGEVVRPSP